MKLESFKKILDRFPDDYKIKVLSLDKFEIDLNHKDKVINIVIRK